MVRLQPGVLDIDSDDVRFAGKLLEEEPLENRRDGWIRVRVRDDYRKAEVRHRSSRSRFNLGTY